MHDLSKVVEIEPKGDDEPGYSELNQMFPHAVYGAFVAMSQDLPVKVINLILSHSRLTGTRPQTPEAVLLHYLDYGMADVLRSHKGLGLILDLLGGLPPRALFKLHR